MVLVKRPDCAGYHAPCPTCDGSVDEVACSYRDSCKLIIKLSGGKGIDGEPNGSVVERIKRLYTDEDLEKLLLAEQTALQSPSKPRKGRKRTRTTVRGLPASGGPARPRKVVLPPQHPGAVRLVRRFVNVLSSELQRTISGVGVGKVGDLVVRWFDQKRIVCTIGEVIHEPKSAASPTRFIGRFVFLEDEDGAARFVLNSSALISCQELNPPSMFAIRHARESRETMISTDPVTQKNCEAVARWVVRCYRANLIRGGGA